MIDDLVTLGTEEPYRMFTSRAEHRLLLGCDSVYERLTPIAGKLRILDDERRKRADGRLNRMRRATEAAESTVLAPDRSTQEWCRRAGIELTSQAAVGKLTQRAEFDLGRFVAAAADALPDVSEAFGELSEEEREGVVSALRYAGYIERQQREAAKAANDEETRIPADLSFALPGLSREVVEKLTFVRPHSLAQAGRIPGVTPAAISILRMHLRRGREARAV
jgi:tRNA uridine 5-carboxymethylaminomethyl modification enzyme